MASDKILNYISDYGDLVEVKQIAPKEYRPGKKGSICGMRKIDSPELSKKFEQEIGSEIYLVEFGDGKSFEIPEFFLIRYFV